MSVPVWWHVSMVPLYPWRIFNCWRFSQVTGTFSFLPWGTPQQLKLVISVWWSIQVDQAWEEGLDAVHANATDPAPWPSSPTTVAVPLYCSPPHSTLSPDAVLSCSSGTPEDRPWQMQSYGFPAGTLEACTVAKCLIRLMQQHVPAEHTFCQHRFSMELGQKYPAEWIVLLFQREKKNKIQ